MPVYKSSGEDFSTSKPVERLGKLKWWFVILLILGILALFYAQQSPPQGTTESVIPRVIIMAGVFGILGIVYPAGIFKLFFSGNAAQVDTAADLVKTLTGFFVGVATSFLG
jgi:hypothetical protein